MKPETITAQSSATVAASSATDEIDFIEIIDDVAKHVLGDDPRKPPTIKNVVHSQLIVRWITWINNGLDKNTKDKLLELAPQFDAHRMNHELTHNGLGQKAKIRDGHFINTQKTADVALTVLGLGISPLLSNNNETANSFSKNYLMSEKIFHFCTMDNYPAEKLALPQ